MGRVLVYYPFHVCKGDPGPMSRRCPNPADRASVDCVSVLGRMLLTPVSRYTNSNPPGAGPILFTMYILSDIIKRSPSRQELHGQYVRDRALIPADRLIEVPFSDLDTAPLQVLENIYNQFGW
jgi:hypothetical protein